MKIWVDADAGPVEIKEILFRSALRTKTATILVANLAMRIPPSNFISRVQVSSGFDVGDYSKVNRVENADLVITGDRP
ncbi:YaiI/YqxD family protein, partial [Pseudoalteromonas sp. S326]|uniref:DUF188 domain-containing protein n=1 Tax=Pseudoalteromonas sp. S326 TaxID=579533 RepID=UPI00127FB2EB